MARTLDGDGIGDGFGGKAAEWLGSIVTDGLSGHLDGEEFVKCLGWQSVVIFSIKSDALRPSIYLPVYIPLNIIHSRNSIRVSKPSTIQILIIITTWCTT